MKILVLFFFSALLAGGASAQRDTRPEMGDSRNVVRQKLQRYLEKYKRVGELIDTDTALLLRAPMQSDTVLFSYGFDARGRLAAYGYSGCRACVQQFLTAQLEDKRYDWRQLNDSVYYAKYSRQRLLQVRRSGDALSFTVSTSTLTKEEYKALWQTPAGAKHP